MGADYPRHHQCLEHDCHPHLLPCSAGGFGGICQNRRKQQLRHFFRIVIPVSGPVLATIALFTAVGYWNDWFTGAIYITKDHLLPIQTLLRQIMNSNIMTQIGSSNAIALDHMNRNRTITTKSLTMATMMIATIPIILTYPFLQKYFVKGVMIGSMKE